MKLLVLIMLSLTACGKSGNTAATSVPVTPPGTTTHVTLHATRDPSGPTTTGTVTITQTGVVTIPQASDVQVVQNSSEYFHGLLNIGPSIQCDYTHNAGISLFTTGSCNTFATTVNVNPGDTITLAVGNQVVTNYTYIQVTLTIYNP